jgi:hypothetical protein
MSRFLVGAFALICLFSLDAVQAQQKLASTGWGSLTGKVTYDGTPPVMADLTPKMMLHQDKACCLDPMAKPFEKIEQTWVVDPKTKAVANVMVYLKAPAGFYLPTHPKLTKKPGAVIDQPHCAFIPHVAAYNPKHYDDNGKMVDSGQTFTIKNSATVSHNTRAITQIKYNTGFNDNMPAKTEAVKKLNPQPLPVTILCDAHTWMNARLFVFDHPYYAITNKDGVFELPFVPAGAELIVMAHHEDVGFVLAKKDGEKLIIGEKMTLKAGKNTLDFQIKK